MIAFRDGTNTAYVPTEIVVTELLNALNEVLGPKVGAQLFDRVSALMAKGIPVAIINRQAVLLPPNGGLPPVPPS